MELQRRERMDRQLAALPALVVGEPDDAARVEALDEDDARRRPAFGADGRQRHRVRLGQLRGDRLLEPRPELLHRIGRRRRFVELGPLVALAQRGDVGHRRSIETRGPARGLPDALARGAFALRGKALRRPPTTPNDPATPILCRMSAQRTVVVLAAGRSERFGAGRHKLAQPLGASTVLAQTLARAIASHLRTVVVTTAAFVDVARSSVAARDVVVLPDVGSDGSASLGMGTSIAAGVAGVAGFGRLARPARRHAAAPAGDAARRGAGARSPCRRLRAARRPARPSGRLRRRALSRAHRAERRRRRAPHHRPLSGVRGRPRRPRHPRRHRHRRRSRCLAPRRRRAAAGAEPASLVAPI